MSITIAQNGQKDMNKTAHISFSFSAPISEYI